MKDYFSLLNNKIISPHDWENISSSLLDKKVVFTNGCFDILHVGHVDYLAQAKNLGDILVVGLNSDNSVKRLKGPERPVNSQYARARLLAALESVDYVVIFDDDTPLTLIKSIKPNVLVKGGDYSFQSIVGAQFVTDNGGFVYIIPLVEGYSTTQLIHKLNKNS